MRIRALAALLIATPAAAQTASPVSDEAIRSFLEKGEEVESRTDGDLNGDGQPDTVLIGRGDDTRTLKVLLLARGEFDIDLTPVGTLKLDSYPLGAAEVSIAKGVLKITDLTGGTTAVNAVYRYRLVPGPKPRMRLIGIDATLYSRTYAHDGAEISWNLLTGDYISREMKLNKKGGNAAYDPILEKKSKKPSKVVLMEDTPDPNELLGWGDK
ncbi:hypothetical protein HNP52_001872 [Sphingomonas kyeonggiensis]|uniref:VCBS repeat-containing protein n=1 Tax=Sphingomonas kyeonggiensis TaxID=1268553 RepID=A0A7W7NRD8_9SPHN|nr:hypothetical protein [Sphingomonas kyeonggiensis]MBB4838803.1 hypothetical protein [Sphingomonas kyeonggiensis]